MSEQFVTTTKHFRKLLAAGYLLIVLLVGGIICTWLGEWRDLELLERENREINRFRKETHDAYVGVVELSLLGESVLEWDDKDVAAYRRQRMTVDSMLCRFKSHYESVRIDKRAPLAGGQGKAAVRHHGGSGTTGGHQPPDSQAGAGDSANEQAGRAEETEEERFSRVVRQETGSTSDDDHHDALHTEP